MNDLVSIIIPCRNEEGFIGKCLDSIVANDFQKDRLEILVVDGQSEDRTREIVAQYVARYPFIQLLENPKRIIPAALNVGIQHARGDLIMRMDAHTTYAQDYISKCVEFSQKYGADSVGGIWKIVPQRKTLLGQAIAIALSHPFGVGNSQFRITRSSEPRWVDTVPFGCYRKEAFARIGLFNEDLARSEDMDFSIRLRQAGGRILLVPEIVSYYYARSDYRAFARHNFLNGIWVTYPLRFGRKPFSWRHLVPLVFVLAVIVSAALVFVSPLFWPLLLAVLGSYSLLNLIFSIWIAARERDVRLFFVMPVVFAALHVPYGLGSLSGLSKVLGEKICER